MYPTLETLDMTPDQLAAAREAVCRRAYQNWLDAGQPSDADVECWLQAEQQWIAQDYVPPRPLDGQRPDRSLCIPPLSCENQQPAADALTV